MLRSKGKGEKDSRDGKNGRTWLAVEQGERGKIGITFKYKEKLGAGVLRGQGEEMERGKKSVVVRGPTVRAHYLDEKGKGRDGKAEG